MRRQRISYFEDPQDPEQTCSRCRMCELICSFQHYHVGNPRRSKIRVVSLGKGVDIPVTCLNCEDAPCVRICPTGALNLSNAVTTVIVNKDLCIGCAMCVNACPIGAITLDPILGVASKCDLCDGDPQCVKYCPANVLKMTDSIQFARHRMTEYVRSIKTNWE